MSADTTPLMTHDVVGTRVLDAPPEEVWRAWVEPELVKQWWGPIELARRTCRPRRRHR